MFSGAMAKMVSNNKNKSRTQFAIFEEIKLNDFANLKNKFYNQSISTEMKIIFFPKLNS